jgi:hypothetical protein
MVPRGVDLNVSNPQDSRIFLAVRYSGLCQAKFLEVADGRGGQTLSTP